MEDPEVLLELLVANAVNSGKKGSRIACLPILRSLAVFSVEHAPEAKVVALFEALLKRKQHCCFIMRVACRPTMVLNGTEIRF
jgi:hypothetical protein